MAAAVPTFMMEANGANKLREGYDRTIRKGGEEFKSLYSTNDLVLGIAFPFGQTLAEGDEGFFPSRSGS